VRVPEPPPHAYEASALGTRRVRAVLQKAGGGYLPAAENQCAGRGDRLERAGADGGGYRGGEKPQAAPVQPEKSGLKQSKTSFFTSQSRWLFVFLCHANGTGRPIERGPFRGCFPYIQRE